MMIILPILLGVFLIIYFVGKLSDEDIKAIIHSFKTANYWWVLLSLILAALSHLSRAYRWQLMIKPIGYQPKFLNSIMTVMIAYLVNLGIPRTGEIARATAISKYENIPVQKALGTIVAERISDVIMLFLFIGIAFYLQADLIKQYVFKGSASSTLKTGIVFVALTILSVLFYRFLQRAKHPFFVKIKTIVNGLVDGAVGIFKMRNKWQFIAHTLFIWLMYLLMFYVVSFALPETSNLTLETVIVGFVVGSLSMALTNGGLGAYPIAVAGVLILYNIEKNPANAFAWILWTAQTAMVLLLGGLSFLFLPIYNRKK
ncbi:MAG: TIGR00374 family protein [Flavobacteriales bacterium]|nr:MAG: TIGR00374 family protein [Flavobacteriales bacterium]